MHKVWTNWSKRKRIGVVLGAAAGILVLVLVYPGYRNYIEEDNAVTCYDARYWTGVRYQQAIRSSLEEGATAEELDYEQLLCDVVEANFSYALGSDLVSDDLCRGGGICTFRIDPDTHGLSIDCDHEGHDHYDDGEVTDELMDYVTW